jgi:hypothetical protein
MYKITDVVEVGHSKFTGGTVTISFIFDSIVDKEYYLKVIDRLDHCLITDNKEMAKMSHRYILVEDCNNLFIDIHSIMSQFVDERVKHISVEMGKESFTEPHNSNPPTHMLSYNIEG